MPGYITRILCLGILVVFLSVSFGTGAYSRGTSAPGRKISKLEKRLNDIVDLRQRLKEKGGEIFKLRDYYRSKIKYHEKEISGIRNRQGIHSFNSAIRNMRIKNDLTLIQSELAYLEKLDQIEKRIRAGREELLYLQRQTRDDIDFMKVLGDKEISELVKSIDKAIRYYLPDAGELVINVKGVEMQSPEKIWNDIVSGRL